MDSELEQWKKLAEGLQKLTYEEFHKDFQETFPKIFGGIGIGQAI